MPPCTKSKRKKTETSVWLSTQKPRLRTCMFVLVSIRFVDSRAWEFQLCNKKQFRGLAGRSKSRRSCVPSFYILPRLALWLSRLQYFSAREISALSFDTMGAKEEAKVREKTVMKSSPTDSSDNSGGEFSSSMSEKSDSPVNVSSKKEMSEYPTGMRLVLLAGASIMGVFLIALDQVSFM